MHPVHAPKQQTGYRGRPPASPQPDHKATPHEHESNQSAARDATGALWAEVGRTETLRMMTVEDFRELRDSELRRRHRRMWERGQTLYEMETQQGPWS